MDVVVRHRLRVPPAVPALAALTAGYMLARVAVPWWAVAGLLVAGALLSLTYRWLGLGLLLLLAGAAWARWHAADASSFRAVPDGAPVHFQGTVLERIERDELGVDLRARGWLRTRPDEPARHGTVLIRCPDAPDNGDRLDASVRYGSLVHVRGRLIQPTPARNPGGFDQRLYLATQDVEAVVRVKSLSRIRIAGVGGFPWLRAMDRFRARLLASSRSYLPPPYDALFAGVLLGERRGIPRDLHDDFVRGGVVHVLVVSGANFALLAGVVYIVLRVVWMPLRAVYVATMLASLSFAALVGFQPSVVRAGLVIALFLTARLLERDADAPNLLAVSAIIILIAKPVSLFDVGFQLSFGAATALVTLVPVWNRALRNPLTRLRSTRAGRFVAQWVVQTIFATVAVQIVTAPIVAFHFQRVQLAGVAANIPVVLLVAGISVASFIAAMVGLVSHALGGFFGGAVWLGFTFLIPIVRFFARLPGAVVLVPRPNAFELVLYAGACAALFVPGGMTWIRQRRARWITACVGAVGCVVWSLAIRPPDGLLEATFIDVGQGDSAFVRLPNGSALLVDAGPRPEWTDFDTGERVVVPYLLTRGVRHLDWIVQSHSDNDHAGGVPGVLDSLSVAELVGLPPGPVPLATDRATRESLVRRRVPSELGAGRILADVVVEGVPLRIAVVRPMSDGEIDYSDDDVNDDSLVLRIDYGAFSMLLPGDIENPVEDALVAERNTRLSATVLKVAHHGSKTSTGTAFLRRVQPRVAVVSAGRGNSYGHPSKEALDRLRQAGVKVFRTDRDGAVTIISDGRRCWIRTAL